MYFKNLKVNKFNKNKIIQIKIIISNNLFNNRIPLANQIKYSIKMKIMPIYLKYTCKQNI